MTRVKVVRRARLWTAQLMIRGTRDEMLVADQLHMQTARIPASKGTKKGDPWPEGDKRPTKGTR